MTTTKLERRKKAKQRAVTNKKRGGTVAGQLKKLQILIFEHSL